MSEGMRGTEGWERGVARFSSRLSAADPPAHAWLLGFQPPALRENGFLLL